MAYEYENSVVNSNTQLKQRPNICYFLSDIEKQMSYDELLNMMDILKCTHKRIKDRLRKYYEKIWKICQSKIIINWFIVNIKQNLKWNDT